MASPSKFVPKANFDWSVPVNNYMQSFADSP